MTIEPGFWRGATVCVTGARGALGTRLVRALDAAGARVVALDRTAPPPPTAGAGAVRHVEADVRDTAALDDAMRGAQVVCHLAALVDAGESFRQPVDYFEVNALGTCRVLDSARRAGVHRAVYMSTSHVYGASSRLLADERDPVQPLSPYAASKLAGEAVVASFARAFGLACDVLRPANLYGAPFGGITVVGRALQAARGGGPIALRTFSPIRDFLYVDDAIEAIVRVGEAPAEAGRCRVLNVGTGAGVSVGEMAVMLADALAARGHGRPALVETDPGASDAIPAATLDTTMLRQVTGWQPATRLPEGLALSLDELAAVGARCET